MKDSKSVGRAVGLLLLVQMVAGLTLPYILLVPISTPAGAFLENAAEMPGTVRLSVFMLFAGSAVSLVIAIDLWPGASERQPQLALWLIATAIISFALQLLENAHWLSLLSISQAYVAAGGNDPSAYQAVSLAAHSTFRWVHYSHIFFAVAWLFVLHLLFYRSASVPRPLAALGMGTALLHFIGVTLPVFGSYRMPYSTVFGAPLGIAILVVALWLLIKGFAQRSVGAASANTAVQA